MITRLDRAAKKMSISRSAILRMAMQQWLDATEQYGTNPLLIPPNATRPSITKSGRVLMTKRPIATDGHTF
jgi:hypothetical protein